MAENFWDMVRTKAYYKYLNRMKFGLMGDALQDWDEAFREQMITDRINEEAYFHYLNGGSDPDRNWAEAYREINERIAFLAYYQHESKMHNSPVENWINAQRIYIGNF